MLWRISQIEDIRKFWSACIALVAERVLFICLHGFSRWGKFMLTDDLNHKTAANIFLHLLERHHHPPHPIKFYGADNEERVALQACNTFDTVHRRMRGQSEAGTLLHFSLSLTAAPLRLFPGALSACVCVEGASTSCEGKCGCNLGEWGWTPRHKCAIWKKKRKRG